MTRQVGKKKALFVFQKMKAELIHNMVVAEGSQLTAIQTKTIIEDKVTPNGAKVEDIEQAMRLSRAFDEVANQIKNDTFNVGKGNFIKINSIVAINEALSVGDFRNAQVYIMGSNYVPPDCSELDKAFTKMMRHFNRKTNIEEKASDLFLDSARNQYFFEGNKRTAQIIMNGYLITNGFSPRSIAKENIMEYNEKMAYFYETNDKAAMYDFLAEVASPKRYSI